MSNRSLAKSTAKGALLASTAFALTAFAAPAAFAQDADVEAGEAEASGNVIIVRARKVEESILDVPISVSALNADDLERQGVSNLQELESIVPNAVITEVAGSERTAISIRGIDSRTGVYLDEIFVTGGEAFANEFLDIESVEVLRGPQGTLFGRNTVAGAINIYTRRPNDEFSAAFAGEYGNFDTINLAGTVNVPIAGDALALKVSGNYLERDGTVENLAGPDLNAAERFGIRGQLKIEPTEGMVFLVTADHSERDDTGFGWEPLAPTFTPNDMIDPDDLNRETALDGENFVRTESTGISLRGEFDVGPFELITITAYRDGSTDSQFELDYTPTNLLTTATRTEREEITQEIRLQGEIGGSVEWLVGGYYFQEKSTDFNRTIFSPDVPTPLGLTLGQIAQGLFGIPPTDVASAADLFENRETFAVFGSTTIDLSDQLALTLGLRWSREEFDVNRFNFSTVAAFAPILQGAGLQIDAVPFIADGSDDDVSPNVSLVYKPTSDVSVYATYSQGFSAGGIASPGGVIPAGVNVQDLVFGSETINNYEIGIKSLFLDDRLAINASAFYLEYQDIQAAVDLAAAGAPPFIVTANAGEAEVFGLEIEAFFDVTSDFTLTAGLGYLDTELVQASPLAQNTVGNELARAPEITATFSGRYTVDLDGAGELSFGGGLNYRGESFFTILNRPIDVIEETLLLNLNAEWRDPSETFTIFANATNVTGESFITNTAAPVLPGLPFAATLNQPSLYSVGVRVNF